MGMFAYMRSSNLFAIQAVSGTWYVDTDCSWGNILSKTIRDQTRHIRVWTAYLQEDRSQRHPLDGNERAEHQTSDPGQAEMSQ